MIPASIPVYRGNALHPLLDDFQAAKAARKEAEGREAEARDAILQALKGRPALRVGDRVVRVRTVSAVPPVTVTVAMLGRVMGGRKGHRVVEVVPAGGEP